MKKVLICIVLCVLAVSAWSEAEFRPEVKEYDFGEILEKDGMVTYDFVFRNAGDEPLLLIDVHAG